jgi:hypothetical protein
MSAAPVREQCGRLLKPCVKGAWPRTVSLIVEGIHICQLRPVLTIRLSSSSPVSGMTEGRWHRFFENENLRRPPDRSKP